MIALPLTIWWAALATEMPKRESEFCRIRRESILLEYNQATELSAKQICTIVLNRSEHFSDDVVQERCYEYLGWACP